MLVVFASFALAGCRSGKDSEVSAFIKDADTLTADIVQRVKANPSSAGVTEAQRILDDKKANMKAKYDSLKAVRGSDVSEETMKKFTDSTFKNIESVNDLKLDLINETLADEDFGEKIDKLVNDYNDLYGV